MQTNVKLQEQSQFYKYQKLYALLVIIYNAFLLAIIVLAFVKSDEKFNILSIVIGFNGVYAIFDLITNIVFIMSKPFDQDISSSTIITSLSDTLFHNGIAIMSLIIVLTRNNRSTKFWKFSCLIVIIVFIRSVIMLVSEIYWWFMLKKTVKNHTEDDFIIPEEELNTQYHQISYDYHNPKRLFNQSNVVILNKKQKKKIHQLQLQQEEEDRILEGREDFIMEEISKNLKQNKNKNKNKTKNKNKSKDKNFISSSASTSNHPPFNQQQNKSLFDQYVKERLANDNEANYQYLRQQNQEYGRYVTFDSDSDSDSDNNNVKVNDNNNDTDINNNNNNNGQPSTMNNENDGIFIYSNYKNISEPTVVEMYSSPYNNNDYSKRTTISSSSSSSSSSSNLLQYQHNFESTSGNNRNNSDKNNNINNNVIIPTQNNIININMQDSIKNENQDTINTINLDSNNTELIQQKTKLLNYIDRLIQENKEKKKQKQQAQQENPEKWNRKHPREWFSEVMGVKAIQEEKDANLFVKAKQKKEKEIIEQKMENLKNQLEHADTPEQVEVIFKDLRALNGIW